MDSAYIVYIDFPGGTVLMNLPANAGNAEDQFRFLGRENTLSKKWLPTPVFLPGKSHGHRSLVGCIVHGITKRQIRLSMHTRTYIIYGSKPDITLQSQTSI